MPSPRPSTLQIAQLATMLLLSGVTVSAAADVPPPPDFVETCTVAIGEQRTGGHCERVDTFHGGVAPETDAALRARGLAPRCAGGGATVGFAVYCSAVDAPATTVPPSSVAPPTTRTPSPAASSTTNTTQASSSACSATPGGRSAPLALSLLLGLAILGRRAWR